MNGIVNSFDQYKLEYLNSFTTDPKDTSKLVIFCAMAFFHGGAQGVLEMAWSPFDWTYYVIVSTSSLFYKTIASIFSSIFTGVNQISNSSTSNKININDIKMEDNKIFIKETREGFEKTKAKIQKIKVEDGEASLWEDLKFAESVVECLLCSGKKMYKPEDPSLKELETLLKDIQDMQAFSLKISFLEFSPKIPKDQESKDEIKSEEIDLIEIKKENSKKLDYNSLHSGEEIYKPGDSNFKELESLLNEVKNMQSFRSSTSSIEFSAEIPKDQESEGKIKSEEIDLIEIKKEESKTVEYTPPRFYNNYNRCYLNSTMQSLIVMAHFRNLIRNFNSENWKTKCLKEFIKCDKDLLDVNLSEVRKIVIKEDKDAVIRKYKAGTIILNLMKDFLDDMESQKGDCNKIMNKIREQMFEGAMHFEFKGKNVNNQMDASAAFETLFDLYDQKTLYERIVKQNGVEISQKVEPITVIPMGIDLKKNETFQEILVREFSDEVDEITNDITYKARIKLENQEIPPIVVIQLKRLQNPHENKKIPLHNFQIDLSKAFNTNDPINYKLVSVVYRPSGGTSGGHYVSRVCHDGQWWHCDDTDTVVIKKIKPEEVKPEDGYMFVFERI
jgi:ubiquitin C-terminal hydrolase